MLLKDIFNAKSVALSWNDYAATSNAAAKYLGTGLFPSKKKAGLDLKFLKGASGLPVALMPSAFDSEARLRDRIGVSEMITEMPFFREGFLVKEADRQELLRVQDATDPYAQAVIDRIYDDANNLIEGALVVPEIMRMQLLVDGTIGINYNGANYEYNYGGVAQASSTAKWSDATNADPIADLQAAQEQIYEATGVKPDVAIMTTATLKLMRDNKKVQAYVLAGKSASAAAKVFMTTALVKQYVAEELGITIVEYNLKYKDNAGTTKQFYPDNYVTLVPSNMSLGNTWFGTTPEEADFVAGQGDSMALVETGIAVATIHKNHPVQEETIASEIVLPSFENADKVITINVDPAGE